SVLIRISKCIPENSMRLKLRCHGSSRKLADSRRGSWRRRSRLASASDNIEHKQTSRQQRGSDNEDGKLPRTPRREQRVRRNVLGAFHPFRSCFERPGNV